MARQIKQAWDQTTGAPEPVAPPAPAPAVPEPPKAEPDIPVEQDTLFFAEQQPDGNAGAPETGVLGSMFGDLFNRETTEKLAAGERAARAKAAEAARVAEARTRKAATVAAAKAGDAAKAARNRGAEAAGLDWQKISRKTVFYLSMAYLGIALGFGTAWIFSRPGEPGPQPPGPKTAEVLPTVTPTAPEIKPVEAPKPVAELPAPTAKQGESILEMANQPGVSPEERAIMIEMFSKDAGAKAPAPAVVERAPLALPPMPGQSQTPQVWSDPTPRVNRASAPRQVNVPVYREPARVTVHEAPKPKPAPAPRTKRSATVGSDPDEQLRALDALGGN